MSIEDGQAIKQLLLPAVLKKTVFFEQLHDSMGHQDIERTLALVRSRGFWPHMSTYVERHCKNCERCLISKGVCPKIKTKMCHLLTTRPLDNVAMDFTLLAK